MEHKLIQGGESYLPFARSRIKALKATGLKYASQKFEIDGVSIRVRIAGEHEYIELSGGVQSLEMDSGVVDVFAVGELHPNAFKPGLLWETNYVAGYNAGYVMGDAEDGLRRKESPGSAGQLAGSISKTNSFKGAVPEDGIEAKSFSPMLITDSSTSTPTEQFDPADGYLFYKKTLGVLCPPSIFTGKCRLYVQAMYGKTLYEGEPGKEITQTLPRYESGTTAAPVLWFDLVDKDLGNYKVMLSTSSGVHLDKKTGKHWLFNPTSAGTLVAYPLKSSPAGEALRKYLVSPQKGKDQLSEEDQEHLEAHILAYCLPSLKGRQTLAGITGYAYSMGYGWHWNWSGLIADMVVNSSYEQDPTNQAMISTHLRLTMARLEDAEGAVTWSVAQSVVEADKKWAVYRAAWCISEPDYSVFKQSKTTPQRSLPFVCDAPFYAFYERDELQVCRVIVTERQAYSTYDESPGFQGATTPGITYGLSSGFKSTRDFGWGYFVTVTVGSRVTPTVPYGVTDVETRIDISDKALLGFGPGFGSVTQYATRDYGCGPTTSYLEDERMPGTVTYKYTASIRSEVLTGSCTVVVPFYDAEACYIGASSNLSVRTVKDIKNFKAYLLGASWVRKTIFVFIDGIEGSRSECVFYGDEGSTASAGHALEGQSTGDETVDTIPASSYRLASKGGVHPVDFGPLGEFSSNALEYGPAFYTLSSARPGSDAAIVSWAPRTLNIGMPAAPPGVGIFVGWA